MSLDLFQLVLLIGAGAVAGAINTIAGGGSLLTLPVLIFVGLPAPVANGTNRISVLLQSIVGTWSMHRKVRFPIKPVLVMAVPTTVGAAAGAWTAAQLSAEAMETAIGVALLAGAALLLARPKRFLREETDAEEELSTARKAVTSVVLVAVGFYGGFLQAGVGALFLVALVLVGRWATVEATGAKNLLIAIYTIPALVVFTIHDEVALVPGLVMAVGAMAGAEAGARMAVKGGAKLILGAVVVAVLIAGMRLMGVF